METELVIHVGVRKNGVYACALRWPGELSRAAFALCVLQNRPLQHR